LSSERGMKNTAADHVVMWERHVIMVGTNVIMVGTNGQRQQHHGQRESSSLMDPSRLNLTINQMRDGAAWSGSGSGSGPWSVIQRLTRKGIASAVFECRQIDFMTL
jgi:hypothetical protein